MSEQIEFRSGVIRPIECLKEGWEFIKPNFWLFFAISIVGLIIGGATLYILLGAMVCGIFYVFLASMDGSEPKFEDLFKGFSFWKPSLLVVAVIVVPTLVMIGLIYVPVLVAMAAGVRFSEDQLFAMLAGTFAVEAVFSVFVVCLHTLLMFSFPLIVDKNLSGVRAMMVSAKAVWQNLSGVAGLWAVCFFVTLAGYLALCFGIYLTIPIVLAANVVAYRKVFPGTFVRI